MNTPTFVLLSLMLLPAANPAQIPGTPTFQDDFGGYHRGSDGTPSWKPVKGSWAMSDSSYIQESAEYDCASMLSLYQAGSFSFEFTFELLSGDPGVGFVFSSRSSSSTDFAQMVRFDGTNTLLAGYYQSGEYTATTSAVTDSIQPGTLHRMRLVVNSDSHSFGITVDNRKVLEGIPLVYSSGYTGLQCSAGKVRFHQVRLYADSSGRQEHRLDWVERFALGTTGEIFVPNPRIGSVEVFSPSGIFLRQIGIPATARGQLHQPAAVALLENNGLVVADLESNQLHLFSPGGQWLRTTGWKGSARGTFDQPCALTVDGTGHVFVVDKGNHRIQVFDDQLNVLTDFGADRLIRPSGIAIDGDVIYVLNAGMSQVEFFSWNGRKASWRKSLSYGGGDARGIAVHEGRMYLSVVNELRSYDTTGVLLGSFRGRAIDFIFPCDIAIERDGGVMFSDFFSGRLVRTDSGLLDPEPTPLFSPDGQGTISWTSPLRDSSIVEIRGHDGTTMTFQGQAGTHHLVRIPPGTLRPGTTYRYSITPVTATIPLRKEPSRFYPLAVPAGSGIKTYARLPMAVVLFANVRNDQIPSTGAVQTPALPESEIARVMDQIRDAVRFYWIHSAMNVFLDVEFIVVRETMKRSSLYGSEWWYPPREETLRKIFADNGKTMADYHGIVYLSCTQSYDSAAGAFVLNGKGGGFTNGVGTGKGYGISWWEATRAHHNAGNNWLMVHEFNHQLDDIFMVSGYPEYWFNHISPTIGTAGPFGEHFDANAFILRMVPRDEWLDLRYTELRQTRDADGDGIPDNDPSLPLDEARLGSDSTRIDTDGDGVSDLAELRSSNWISEGWGETYGGVPLFPNLRERDTDGDGLDDRVDPYPCYPAAPLLHRLQNNATTPFESSGWNTLLVLRDDRINATIYDGWDDSTLSFVIDLDRPLPVKMMLDAGADGWFSGAGNILLQIAPQSDSALTLRQQIFNGADPTQWPFMDPLLIGSIRTSATLSHAGAGYRYRVTIGRSDRLGLGLHEHDRLGLSFGFLTPFGRGEMKRYITPFEPNRLFNTVLVR